MTKREEILTVLHGTSTATTTQIATKLDTTTANIHNDLKNLEMDGEIARTEEKRWHVT